MNRTRALVAGGLVALGSLGSLGTGLPATAGGRPATAPPGVVLDDAQISLAKLGITMFSLDELAGTVSECPTVREDQVGYWMGQLGMVGTTQGYEVDAFTSQDVDALVVHCGVNPGDFIDTPDPAAPFAVAVQTYQLLESTLADLLGALVNSAQPSPVADPSIGGEVATSCGQPGRVACLSFWHRDGLVVNVLVVGPGGELDAARAEQLTLSLVPDAVVNLAAYQSASSPTTPPTVAPTPTAAPVTTAAPATTGPTAAPLPSAAPLPTGAPSPTIGPPGPSATPPVVTTSGLSVQIQSANGSETVTCADVASAATSEVAPCTEAVQLTWDEIATADPAAFDNYVYDQTIGIFTSADYTIEQTAILGLFACNAAATSPTGGQAFWQGMMGSAYPEASQADLDAAWAAAFSVLCPWLG